MRPRWAPRRAVTSRTIKDARRRWRGFLNDMRDPFAPRWECPECGSRRGTWDILHADTDTEFVCWTCAQCRNRVPAEAAAEGGAR